MENLEQNAGTGERLTFQFTGNGLDMALLMLKNIAMLIVVETFAG